MNSLPEIAGRWLGTPFASNACVPGPTGGVSCQGLAGAIYVELGVFSPDVEIPVGRMTRGRFSRQSEILPWIASRPEFLKLPLDAAAEPGQLLGFQIGHCLNHLGVVVDGTQFVHCLEGPGVMLSSLEDATWMPRLAGRWAPLGGRA
ncbi:MAG: hypothetical protein J0L84_00355 [Verrucomicrobia bacterium]|nr:hypothetical protein [Verrucomicrobiota bacterium]